MLIEIEEAVCFLASFLYGTIPRRRVDAFAEILANRLVALLVESGARRRVYHFVANDDDKSDPLILNAAEEAYMSVDEMQSLLPDSLILELRPGFVNAVHSRTGECRAIYDAIRDFSLLRGPPWHLRNNGPNPRPYLSRAEYRMERKKRPPLRLCYDYRVANEEGGMTAHPYFELYRPDDWMLSKVFVGTRFGSGKPKSNQGVDGGHGIHPFTTPSFYAYIQLHFFLHALACVTAWSEKIEEEAISMEQEAAARGETLYGSDVLESDVRESDVRESDVFEPNVHRSEVPESDVRGLSVSESDVRESDILKADALESDAQESDKCDADNNAETYTAVN